MKRDSGPLSWTGYVLLPGALEVPPRLADIPDNSRAFRNVGIATAIAAVLIAACIVLLRGLDGGAAQFAVMLIGAVGAFLWLFLVLPQMLAHRFARRWARAYARLCADPRRADARIDSLELSWNQDGSQCTIMGGLATYVADDGKRRTVPLTAGFGKAQAKFVMRIPRRDAPSTASNAVAWHSEDHGVVHVLVHADGSGAARG